MTRRPGPDHFTSATGWSLALTLGGVVIGVGCTSCSGTHTLSDWRLSGFVTLSLEMNGLTLRTLVHIRIGMLSEEGDLDTLMQGQGLTWLGHISSLEALTQLECNPCRDSCSLTH